MSAFAQVVCVAARLFEVGVGAVEELLYGGRLPLGGDQVEAGRLGRLAGLVR